VFFRPHIYTPEEGENMARARDAYNKKDQEKAKLKKRKDKEQKKEERKASASKGKGLDEMMAYVDSYGNIVSTPPDPGNRPSVNLEDIVISTSKKEETEPEDLIRTGTVTFFNESKGYGFIRDHVTQQSIFVHIGDLESPVKENNKVTFETRKGPKGLSAVHVKLAS
jgi:cold shock CspA family protein